MLIDKRTQKNHVLFFLHKVLEKIKNIVTESIPVVLEDGAQEDGIDYSESG